MTRSVMMEMCLRGSGKDLLWPSLPPGFEGGVMAGATAATLQPRDTLPTHRQHNGEDG